MFTARIIATILGFFFGGPVGAIIGFLIGSFLDKSVEKSGATGSGPKFNWQQAFNTSLNQSLVKGIFVLMGYLAKIDGQVTPNEIAIASNAMLQLRLPEERRHQAMRWFYEGKNQQFDMNEIILQLRPYRLPPFARIILACLTNITYANGAPTQTQLHALQNICEQLGLPTPQPFQQSSSYSQNQYQYNYNDQHHYSSARNSLADAYEVMGLKSDADVATIRKTYRRMMNKYHPDKLAAKGATAKELKAASDKTIQIRSAYERLMQSKGVNV